MSIASRINEMTEHLRNDWDSIDKLGLDITEENSNDNLDKNIENIAPVLDRFYNQASDKTDLSENGIVGRTSQNTAILPNEYTQVDYIESSGTQYINTSFSPNQDTSVEMVLETLSLSRENHSLFGARQSSTVNHYGVVLGSADGNIVYNGYGQQSNYTNFRVSENTKYKFYKNKNNLYINDNLVFSDTYTTFTPNINMMLLAMNQQNSATFLSSMRVYSCKVYDGNTLVRDFIPCYRNSDNVVGLYDIVNDVFHTNQGTGTFSYGSVVSIPNPDYPQEINNLSGDVEYKVRGKNLFDKNNANILKGWFRDATDEMVLNSVSTDRIIAFEGKPNTTYTISKKSSNRFRVDLYNSLLSQDGTYTFNEPIIKNDTGTSITVTTTSTDYYIYIHVYQSSDGDFQAILNSIQIKYGNTPTEYEPYISESFPLSLKSRNLFVGYNNMQSGFLPRSGSYPTTNSSYPNAKYQLIELKQGESVITSGSISTAGRIRCIDKSTNKVLDTINNLENNYYTSTMNYTDNFASGTITAKKDIILGVMLIYSGFSDNFIISSTPSDYEPYYDIELCNISDYKDRIYSQNGKFYLEKNIGKVVLDGSESGWNEYTQSGVTNYHNSSLITFNTRNGLSNYFTLSTDTSYTNTNTRLILFGTQRGFGVFARQNLFGALANFKTWLSTHNTEVQYVLATPTTTEITQENYPTLYSQLLAIQEFLTKYKINKEFLLEYSSPEIEY